MSHFNSALLLPEETIFPKLSLYEDTLYGTLNVHVTKYIMTDTFSGYTLQLVG